MVTIPPQTPEHIHYYKNQKVTIVGVIVKEPEVRIDKTHYVLQVTEIQQTSSSKKIIGKVLIKAPLYPEYAYGDRLKFSCKIQVPEQSAEKIFRYDKYLATRGIWSICSYPQINFLAHGFGSGGMNFLLLAKQKIAQIIDTLWLEPESSLMAGLLYGNTSNLSVELKDNFNRTGVSHIIAISGFNITIIAVVLMNILIYLGLWRQQAFWVVVVTIIVFVFFTGASASVVRAGIMGIMVVVARQLGRVSYVGNVMTCTATIMVLVNPYIAVWDVGFQLSFLATIGLVYVAPYLEKYISFQRLGKIGEMITENLQSTLAAIIITLPLILYQFGRLSIVAPLVNILILWIIPWLMLLGFIAVIVGSISLFIGRILAWVTHLGLEYVITIVEWFGKQHFSTVELSLPWWGMLLGYLVLFFLLISNKNHTQKN
jgi:competence protein ComEC